MSSYLESPDFEENLKRSRHNRRLERTLAFIAILSVLVVVPFYSIFYDAVIGLEQPIPFSHRVHAGKKQISCLVCHTDATFSDKAGVPPIQTCMLCHTKIITQFPPIVDLKKHYYSNEPVLWVKVSQMPDYAYFSHRVHINKGIDCGDCHGNVREMDRIEEVNQFNMSFCLDCHRSRKVPIDCYACHR